MSQNDLNNLMLKTATYRAVTEENSLEKLKALQKKGGDIRVKGWDDSNLLITLCGVFVVDSNEKCRDYVRYLIKAGIDVNERDKRGMTAIYYGQFVDILLEAGAKLNVRDIYGTTPLMWAANEENHHVMRMFLENGANVDAVDNKGMTALMHTIHSNDGVFEMFARMLIEAGADIYIKNKKGKTFDDLLERHYGMLEESFNIYGNEYVHLEKYKAVMKMLQKTDEYYKQQDVTKRVLHAKVYDSIKSFPKELSAVVTGYAFMTVKDFLDAEYGNVIPHK